MESISDTMYQWAADLYPVARSLSGPGVRKTLEYLNRLLPDLRVRDVPSGTQAFDWEVPDEWSIEDAYIEDEQGRKIIDFQCSNLHVVGYSEPVDLWLNLEELDKHLYSLPEQPDAIPYVTSYYRKRWGFCLSHRQRQSLRPGKYHAVIQSELKPGVLNYGELILPGETEEEIFLSTYICHPSMANNELSGPVVSTALAQWLSSLPERRFTYRIIFIPETIGSIVYLSRHAEEMKQRTAAGFVITCVGDNRTYSYLPSRKGNTLADRVAQHVLKHHFPEYKSYSFLDRGSDERQYCSPGIDLPVCSIMRSKYGTYPEYHTSLDDLDLISPAGLEGAYDIYKKCITILENNTFPKSVFPCEPQLGKRGLYPTVSTKGSGMAVRGMMNLLAYSDGMLDLLTIADLIDVSATDLIPLKKALVEAGLLCESIAPSP